MRKRDKYLPWVIAAMLGLMLVGLYAAGAHATILYVDSNDTGTNAGTIDNPFRTWSVVAESASDTVRVKCGSVFFETFTAVSGTSGEETLYETYGTGALPRFLGCTLQSGWTLVGDNYTKAVATAPRSVLFGQLLGTAVSSSAAVDADLEWYHDGSTLYIDATANTDSICIATRNWAAEIDNDSYIIIDGLLFGKTHHANMYVKNASHHITVRNSRFLQPASEMGNADACASVLTTDSCYDLLFENNQVGDSTGVEANDRRMAAHMAFYIKGSARTTIRGNTIYYSRIDTETFGTFLYDNAIKIVGVKQDSIVVKDNVIYGCGSSGVFLTGTFEDGAYATVSGNRIINPGQAGINPYQTRYAAGADTSVASIVTGNYVSGHNRTAGTLGSGTGEYPGVAGVDHDGNEACGLHFNDGTYGGVDPATPFVLWICEYNEVTAGHSRQSDSGEYGVSGQDGGGVGIDYNAHRTICRYNFIHDNEGPGIYVFNATRNKIYGNLITRNDLGISLSALYAGTEGPASDLEVFHNIVADNWNEGDLGNPDDPIINTEIWVAYWVQDLSLRNNIVIASTDTVGTSTIRVQGTNQSNLTIDCNLHYRSSGTTPVYVGGSLDTWDNWRTAGYDAHGYNSDPLLTSLSADDFTISSGSSDAVGNAVTITDWTKDYNGDTPNVSRDIGPINYTAAEEPAAPAVASADTVQVAADDDDFFIGENNTSWLNANGDYIMQGQSSNDGLHVYNGGYRFTGVTVPKGAKIDSMFVDFMCAGPYTSRLFSFTVNAWDVDDASQILDYSTWFTAQSSLTTASVAWAWTSAVVEGEIYSTDDLQSVGSELFGRPGWVSGNDVMIFVQDNGTTNYTYFKAEGHENGDGSNAAVLRVYYTEAATPGGGNSGQAIWRGSGWLNGQEWNGSGWNGKPFWGEQ